MRLVGICGTVAVESAVDRTLGGLVDVRGVSIGEDSVRVGFMMLVRGDFGPTEVILDDSGRRPAEDVRNGAGLGPTGVDMF